MVIVSPGLIKKYRNAARKLILLDYDGTFVNIAPTLDGTKSTDQVLDLLKKLASDSNTELVIVIGRKALDIDQIIEHIPITIIAEHGALVRENGIGRHQIENRYSWKNVILAFLRETTSVCEGSLFEERNFSVTWHYKTVTQQKALGFVRQIIAKVKKNIRAKEKRIFDGNKTVEILTTEITKVKAVAYLLVQHSYDFILCIGDDKTDEDVFEYLSDNDHAITIKVGQGKSKAKYNLENAHQVLHFLEKICS